MYRAQTAWLPGRYRGPELPFLGNKSWVVLCRKVSPASSISFPSSLFVLPWTVQSSTDADTRSRVMGGKEEGGRLQPASPQGRMYSHTKPKGRNLLPRVLWMSTEPFSPFCNSHIKDKGAAFVTGWQGGPGKGRGGRMRPPSPAGNLTSFGPLSLGSPIKFV